MWPLLLLLVIPLAILLCVLAAWLLAIWSRRSYRCPECGEEIRVEHMHAKRCNMCGAPLREKE